MIMKCSALCTIFAKDKLHTGKGNTTSHCTQSYFPGKI